MLKQLVRSIIACIGFFFFPFFTFGNDGAYTKIESSQTGAAMPINNDAITMAEEKIDIVVDRIRYFYNWLGEGMYGPHIRSSRVITKCLFTFRNESPERQNVLMGYPVTWPVNVVNLPNGRGKIKTPIKKPEMFFFEVMARGREVPFEYATHESNPALPAVGPYQGVYLFKVTFDPHETVTIANTVIQEFEWVWGDIPNYRYILSTGTTWKKPIGRSRLSVSFPNIVKEILVFKSSDYKPSSINGTTFQFEFTNFTPSHDLGFQFDLEVQRIENLGAALRRCHAAKDFEAIRMIHDVMSNGIEFELKTANLDADFLRRMYFDFGNYYYAQNQFYDAGEMFRRALDWSQPMIEYVKYKHRVDSARYRKYLSAASNYESVERLLSFLSIRAGRDAGQPGASYYAAYNIVCCSSRAGSDFIEMFELALALGFPKKDYAWIRKDPDLEFFRKEKPMEFEALLKEYGSKK